MKKIVYVSTFLFFAPVMFASAHSNAVTAVQSCLVSGQKEITWTIINDYRLPETASYSHSTIVNSTDPHLSIDESIGHIIGSATTDELVAGNATSTVTLYVRGTWTDHFTAQNFGQILLDGGCEQPVITPPATTTDDGGGTGTTTPPTDGGTPPVTGGGGGSTGSNGGSNGGGHTTGGRHCVQTTTGLYCPVGATGGSPQNNDSLLQKLHDAYQTLLNMLGQLGGGTLGGKG